MLQSAQHAADVVNVDALVVGYDRGDAVTVTGTIDGNHDIFRVDVAVDGKPARLFARLDPVKTTLQLVAILPTPPGNIDEGTIAGVARYGDAWNVDDDARAAALADGFAENGVYIDPQISLSGRASLAKHIAAFHDSLPLGNIQQRSGTAKSGVAARFQWTTRLGKIGLIDGEDLVVVDDDGRVALVCGFWD